MKKLIATAVQSVFQDSAVVHAAYGAKAAQTPALENGWAGNFYEDRFYEDNESTLGVIFAHGSRALTGLYDACISAFSVGSLLSFRHLSKSAANDENMEAHLRGVREESGLSTQSQRRQIKLMADQYAANFSVEPQSGGGVHIRIPMAVRSLASSLSQAQVYGTGLRETYDGEHKAIWDTLIKQGWITPDLSNTRRSVDIRQFAHSAFPLKPEFFGIEIDVDMGRNAGGVLCMDMTTYKEVRIGSFEEASKDIRMQGRFLGGVCAAQLHFMAIIRLTDEEVRYVTQSETPRLADVVTWFDHALSEMFSVRTPNLFITPLDVYMQREREVNQSTPAKDRRGLFNLMVDDGTLDLVYLPDSDMAAMYDMLSQRSADVRRKHGDTLFRNPVEDDVVSERGIVKKVTRTVGEHFIGVDWASNTLVTSSSDKFAYENISDWAPATTYSILRAVHFNGPVDRNPFLALLSRCMRYLSIVGADLPDFDVEKHLPFVPPQQSAYSFDALRRSKGESLQARLMDVLTDIRNYAYANSTLRNDAPQWVAEWLGDDGLGWSDGLNSLLMPKFLSLTDSNPLRVWLASILDMAYKNMTMTSYAELSQALNLRVRTLLVSHALLIVWYNLCRTNKDYSNFMQLDSNRQRMYGTQPDDIDRVPPGTKLAPVSHIRMPNGVLPHQFKVNYCLEKLPEKVVLSVSAGGGKTLLVLQHAMRLIGAGKARRVLIICPAHLIDGYVNDGCYGGQGSINVVAIGTKSISDYGQEWFEHMVDAAPKNTVFVTDYKFLSANKDAPFLSIGTELRQVFPNAEWVRSMGFDAVILDESHFVKNDSNMSYATAAAIRDTSIRGIASGTLNTTRAEDIVRQMAILDSGVFGSVDRFQINVDKDRTYDPITGTKLPLAQWVARLMEDNSMVVYGRRKEWAALLPPKTIQFHWVQMSEAQRIVYQAILESTLTMIRQDERLMAVLESSDDTAIDDLESMLKTYLQRIEMFLAAPGHDELSVALSDEDKVSPKGKMVAAITRDHIKRKIPGKILVFTSYTNSAIAVYEALPPDLKRAFILYEAGDKYKHRARFESDPSIIGMIGVEMSLNTGVNAQFCSRLIRIESVYSPGALEQGESRINRPMLKGKDPRTDLFMDWVMMDKSLDVTKTGRLMWRSIDRAKMDNPHNHVYQDLPDLDPVRMTLANIMEQNSFDESLSQYMDGYRNLDAIEKREIADYKKRHPNLSMMELPPGPNFEGAGLLKDIPYVPNGGVFAAEDLGLIPFGEVYQTFSTHDEAVAALKGSFAHTGYGDGEISAIYRDTVHVRTPQGRRAVSHQACFIITKKSTSTKSIRERVAESVNLPLLEVTVPETEEGWLCWYGNKKGGAGIWKDQEAGTYGVTQYIGDDETSLLEGAAAIDAVRFLIGYVSKQKRWEYIEGRELEAWLADLTSRGNLTPEHGPAPVDGKPLKVAQLKRMLTVGSVWMITSFQINGEDRGHKYLNKPRTVNHVDSTGVTFSAGEGNGSHFDWPKAGQVFLLDDGGFVFLGVYPDHTLRMEYHPTDAESVTEVVEEAPADEPSRTTGDGPIPDANPVKDWSIEPYLCYVDENYGIYVSANDPDLKEFDLSKYGFVRTPAIAYMHISRWQQLKQFLAKVAASDYVLTGDSEEHLENVMNAMKTQSSHFERYQHMYQSVRDLAMTLRNRKRKTKLHEIHPYIVMYDAEVYLCFDKGINSGLSTFRSQIRVAGAAWEDDENAWLFRGTTKKSLKEVIEAMSRDGIHIANEADVKDAYNAMRAGWKPGTN